jgi:hypothetical protein
MKSVSPLRFASPQKEIVGERWGGGGGKVVLELEKLGPFLTFRWGVTRPHPCKVLASGTLAPLSGNTACDT